MAPGIAKNVKAAKLSRTAKNKWIIKLLEKSSEVGPQPNLLKILKDKYTESTFDEFSDSFFESVMSVIVFDAPINTPPINNIIKFAANGVSMLCGYSTVDECNGLYLVTQVFRLCRKYGNCRVKSVRWRFCLFINHLLGYMSDGAVLSVEMCDVATMLLTSRLDDKKAEVRAQAAHALRRLQSIDNPNCPVVKKFIFHLTLDPSIEVRTAIVKDIAMFNNVIDEMLKTTIFDISDTVRKECYNRFLTYPFLSLSSKQSQIILKNGLDDKNENIKSLVKKRLLDSWLDECDNDYVVFLQIFGVEDEDLSEKSLIIMFEKCYDSQIFDLRNVILNSESRMIDFNRLTAETICLWKCIAKYLTTEKKIALSTCYNKSIGDCYIDILLPDLVKFSNYIREYYFNYDTEEDKEFILTQLLDVARTFTIDDVGAESIGQLCYDLILDTHTSVKPIKSMVFLFDLCYKNAKDLLDFVTKIVNEIQSHTVDVYPMIDKVGQKQMLESEIKSKTENIKELLNNKSESEDTIKMLIIHLNNTKKEYDEIEVSPEETLEVSIAVKSVLKSFELIFQIQQLPKVGSELSLLTDIIQNVVAFYINCSMVNLRMQAIRTFSPFILINDVDAAKKHMITLCDEISKPTTDKKLLFKIMFDIFMYYNIKSFDVNNDLDTNEEIEDKFSTHNILQVLANCIDFEVNDDSFKSVLVKGFCDLLIFGKVKSISLLSKLLIIWFRPLSRESINIYNYLVKFFTSYFFYIQSSSSILAKCYIPILKDFEENDLLTTLGIKIDEVNTIFINLTRGFLYREESKALNAHGELANHILVYLLDENQSYTAMLVDILYKLEVDFNNDDDFENTFYQNLKRVIKHFKKMDDKNSNKYLRKIKNKFDTVLQKKTSYVNKSNKKDDTIELNDELQVPSCSNKKTSPVKAYGDLFSQEDLHVDLELSSDDENSADAFTKLDAIKRMSEIFKKSFNTNSLNLSLYSD